jgi:hypothetical protein
MFARVTQLEIDTLRTSVDTALALFESDVLPELRAHSPAIRACTYSRRTRVAAC